MESTEVQRRVGLGEWSIWGALFFLVSSIAASAVLRGVWAVLGLVYVLAWTSLVSPGAMRTLQKRRFWLFLISITVITALAMGGEETIPIAGLNLSKTGLTEALGMGLRATTIVLATAVFARTASIAGLSALFARIGVSEIGFLLGIAVNLVPLIQNTASRTLIAMQLRGGFRRNRLAAVKRLVVTIVVNTLRHSEDIVCAAEARAFGGAPLRVEPVAITRADRVLMIGAVAFYGVMVLLQLAGVG